MSETTVYRGLAGVVVDYTAVSKVNPDSNSLLYRGYPVQELAAHCSVEEVAWLLWHGELPTPEELAAFMERERAARALDSEVAQVLDLLPSDAHPMDLTRTALSVIGALDADLGNVVGQPDPKLEQLAAERLFAKLPAIVAAIQRKRWGKAPIEPRADLDYAANFLWMTFGEEQAPTVVDVFRVSMILYAEHSFNASTFTGRVIGSTTADLYSAVVGAVGALKGALHGGANEAVLHFFDEIGSADRVSAWLDDALAEKRKVMGFGHRVYRSGDSRVPTMKAALDRLVEERQGEARVVELMSLYDTLEAEFVSRKGIYPNLDYPSGPAYHLIGFDTEVFTPLFVASRVIGWTAHVMEQRPVNALIRPLSAYNGPEERHLKR